MSLAVQQLSVSLDGNRVLEDLRLDVERGSVVGLVGPNGSGKSTLLRTIYRALEPDAGLVTLDGDDVRELSSKAAARRMAVVLQEHGSDFALTVASVVMMGRSPHKRLLEGDSPEDRTIVSEALRRVGMLDHADRDFASLSGGEKQRVLIARALAQRSPLLLLDEPTNHLDVRYQFELMDLLATLGITVVMALHDLNIAAAYCNAVHVLVAGRIVASGNPADVLTPTLVRQVYGIDAAVVTHPTTGRPRLVYASATAR